MSERNHSETGGEDELSDELQHLIDRDVESINFPDKVVAIGGGGRKMVLEMFGQDWLALEAMRDRHKDIDIVFMDTATEDDENHADQVSNLRQKLGNLENVLEENTPVQTSVGSIKVEEHLITENLRIRNRAALIGDDTVNDIVGKGNTDADSWWLRPEHLNATDGSSDFYSVSKGAVKRRALGKALHYKALAQGGPEYRDALQAAGEDDRIAVFAGLGGGTGSGTFIDIAREIRESNRSASINLFVTLPSSSQRDEARANAFAALAELEYLQLTGETPFNDIFLFPLEPTGLSGETTENPELTELDRVMGYALIGVYGGTDFDFGLAETLPYAPFTVVVPQVLHYRRDEIKRRRDEIESLLNLKREVLNLEYHHFERVEEYLGAQYPNATPASGSALSDDAEEYLKERLRKLERILTSELLAQLEIEITNFSDQILEDIYGDLDPETSGLNEVFRNRSLDEIIDRLGFVIENRNIAGGRVDNYAEFGDEFILDVVHTELHRIRECFELLCELRGAEQSTMDSAATEIATDADTKLLETFLVASLEREDKQKRWRTLNTALENTEENLNETTADLSQAREAKEEEEKRHETTVNNHVDQFWSEAEPAVDDLEELTRLNVRESVSSLESALRRYASQVANEDPDAVSEAEVKTEIEGLKTELEGVDAVSFSDIESDIERSLGAVRTARRRWDELEEEVSGDGIIGGLIGGGDDTLDTDEYQTAYQTVNRDGIFDIPRPPNTEATYERNTFTVELDIDLKEELVDDQFEQARRSLRQTVRRAYNETLEAVDETATADGPDAESDSIVGSESVTTSGSGEGDRSVENVLETADPGSMKQQIEEALRRDIRTRLDSDIERYETEIAELEERVDSLRDRKERLDAALAAYDDLTGYADEPLREVYEQYDAKFTGTVFDTFDQRKKKHKIENLYEQHVTPADLSSVVQAPSLAETGLLENRGGDDPSRERNSIRKSIDRIVSNRVRSRRYNGLEQRQLATKDTPAFEHTGVFVAYASEAISSSGDDETNLNPRDFERAKETLQNEFDINDEANQYDQWFVENSDPWDVAMCVFVQGITFLDNLRGVVEPTEGYWNRYQGLTEGRSQAKAIERHALGLEKGYYVTRKGMVDINRNPEFFLEQTENEIVTDLKDRYRRVPIDGGGPTADGESDGPVTREERDR